VVVRSTGTRKVNCGVTFTTTGRIGIILNFTFMSLLKKLLAGEEQGVYVGVHAQHASPHILPAREVHFCSGFSYWI